MINRNTIELVANNQNSNRAQISETTLDVLDVRQIIEQMGDCLEQSIAYLCATTRAQKDSIAKPLNNFLKTAKDAKKINWKSLDEAGNNALIPAIKNNNIIALEFLLMKKVNIKDLAHQNNAKIGAFEYTINFCNFRATQFELPQDPTEQDKKNYVKQKIFNLIFANGLYCDYDKLLMPSIALEAKNLFYLHKFIRQDVALGHEFFRKNMAQVFLVAIEGGFSPLYNWFGYYVQYSKCKREFTAEELDEFFKKINSNPEKINLLEIVKQYAFDFKIRIPTEEQKEELVETKLEIVQQGKKPLPFSVAHRLSTQVGDTSYSLTKPQDQIIYNEENKVKIQPQLSFKIFLPCRYETTVTPSTPSSQLEVTVFDTPTPTANETNQLENKNETVLKVSGQSIFSAGNKVNLNVKIPTSDCDFFTKLLDAANHDGYFVDHKDLQQQIKDFAVEGINKSYKTITP